MPRGRHRHSPPLHRLLPPSAVAGFSLVCAGGAWMFAEPVVLRGLVAAAAASAVVGSVVMRQWDRTAGRRVAELGRARASDEWRYEERIAEAESDLDESRELRTKLESKLRSKRAELAALRNEHAALLRRYATAETERASALEGRRLLAIEAAVPSRALPPAASDSDRETGSGDEVVSGGEVADGASAASGGSGGSSSGSGARVAVRPGASPTPSLYGRANAALERLERASAPTAARGDAGDADAAEAAGPDDLADDNDVDDPDDLDLVVGDGRGVAGPAAGPDDGPAGGSAEGPADGPADGTAGGTAEAHGHERAAARHFTVPAAAAVVPPAQPRRRRAGEGGFDFFGTKGTSGKSVAPAALEAAQNADLADVVGDEVLAVHKAEAEAEFKPSDAATDAERGVGQVIDLTAHDETEQIDVEGLRTALRA
ncbi:coiled-coil domain-containing protein [Streptomyces lasiicapitis]|uniref:hypothetical protein n=1 Tax=Streptomyces lasiicapitis TaxID=1923961 RepID=UPI00367526D9